MIDGFGILKIGLFFVIGFTIRDLSWTRFIIVVLALIIIEWCIENEERGKRDSGNDGRMESDKQGL